MVAPSNPDDEIVDIQTSHNGLLCFLDGARECGADCMAYTVEPTESKNLSIQQKNCTLLVAVERLGRFMGNLSTDVHKMKADGARNVPPPPDPLRGR